MTGSDVASIMNAMNRDDGFLSGNGILIILFFLIFLFNGRGWGNDGNALTQAELQAGLYNQTTDRNLSDIRTAQCNTDMLINNSNYNNLLQAKDLSSQMASCCCENRLAIANQTNTLQAQMTANTQAILDKMCQNEIQSLRDQLNLAEMASANAVQTQNILGSLGRWIPYAGYNGCGCSGTIGTYGTTIY